MFRKCMSLLLPRLRKELLAGTSMIKLYLQVAEARQGKSNKFIDGWFQFFPNIITMNNTLLASCGTMVTKGKGEPEGDIVVNLPVRNVNRVNKKRKENWAIIQV